MTTPTLADFAKALDAVRNKYPDAPGLPEGYRFHSFADGTRLLEFSGTRSATPDHELDSAAALALCVVTAMRAAVHYRCTTGNPCGFRAPGFTRRYEWHCNTWEGKVDSLEAAALAMLVAIGDHLPDTGKMVDPRP